MKVVGLDLGSRTLGIAMSDALGMLATMVETYRFFEDDYESACNYIIDFCNNNKVTKIILGIPKNMDGSIGTRAQLSIDFKDMIEAKSDIEVILIDERLSTKQASNIMISANMNRKKRKKSIDSMAAVVILQSYLDSK